MFNYNKLRILNILLILILTGACSADPPSGESVNKSQGQTVQAGQEKQEENVASMFKIFDQIPSYIDATKLFMVSDSANGVVAMKSNEPFHWVHLNNNGETLWKKSLGPVPAHKSIWFEGVALFRSGDDATVVVGNRQELAGYNDFESSKGWIAKINDEGEIVWQVALSVPEGANRFHRISSAVHLGNHYVVATQSDKYNVTFVENHLLLIDESGRIVESVAGLGALTPWGTDVLAYGINIQNERFLRRIAVENNHFVVKATAMVSADGTFSDITPMRDGSLLVVGETSAPIGHNSKVRIARIKADLSLAWSKEYPRYVETFGRREARVFNGIVEHDAQVAIKLHVLNESVGDQYIHYSNYKPSDYHDERITLSLQDGSLVKMERTPSPSPAQRQVFVEQQTAPMSDQSWAMGFINLDATTDGQGPDYYNVFLSKTNAKSEFLIGDVSCTIPSNIAAWADDTANAPSLRLLNDSLIPKDVQPLPSTDPELLQGSGYTLEDATPGAMSSESSLATCPWQAPTPQQTQVFLPLIAR